MSFPDGRGNQTWSYTKDSLPAQVTTNNAVGGEQVVNSYTYNKRRLLTGEGMSQPGTSAWSLGYAFDRNASSAGITYPQNNFVGYAPNALGQATQAGTYATGVQYFPNGAIKQFTYGNGIVHAMLQNARQLPERSSDIGGGSALDLAYSYDKNSNVASITDYVDGRQTRSMTYDGLDRLKTTTSIMFGGDNVSSYSYNALDDITTLRVGGNRDHTYVYDETTRRLMNVKNTAGLATVVGLDYDARGNLKQKNSQLYDFDFGNRLRSATNQETYHYDGHGRRVRASNSAGNILSMYGQDGVLRRQEDWRTGKLTDYIYLGGSLVARVSNAPTLAAPTATAPAYNTSGGYTVQWTAVTSANAYQLEEQVNGGAWQQVHTGITLSKEISGKAGGAYGYRARGCLAAVCGSWSAVVTVSVQLPPVLAPSLSVPGTAVNGNFTVSWGAVDTATSYTLEQSANGGAWAVSYTGPGQSQAFANIGAGNFSYRVKACNPAGCGDLSGIGTTQALYPPGTPAAPSVPATSATGSYTVSWAAVATADSYRLEESADGGVWVEIQNGASLNRGFAGKAAGSYSYRLRACNAAGCGGYSTASSIQLAPTGSPSAAAPASAPGGTYTVSWTSVTTATTYRLEESVGAGWVQVQDANVLSKAFASKAAGTYAYRVLGCNAAGCGGYSNTLSVDVPHPIPAIPSNPRAVYAILDGIGTRYTFRWDASVGATYYETNGTIAYNGPNLIATRTINGAHVPSRGFVVRACNANGCSAWSASVTSTPAGG